MTRKNIHSDTVPARGKAQPGEKAPAVAIAEREAMAPGLIMMQEGAPKLPAAPPSGENSRKMHPGMKPPWQPGQSGNPAGKPIGTRNKLSTDYLDAIYKQFQESGPGILRDMATSKKMSDRVRFIELVHDLLPRNATLDVSVAPALPRPFAEMTSADWEIALGIRVIKRDE
jgi:hypothetical protein